MDTLVSIITPTYNAIEFIEDTYNSILNQSHTEWEWLVTDDCSHDGTYELLLKLSGKDNRVKVFRNEKNSGAAVSRNNSISHIRGEYFAFIDSDDLWSTTKLEKQLSFMISNNVEFTFTAFEMIDESGLSLNKTVDTHLNKALDYHDMLKKKATLGCSTVMLKSCLFKDLRMPLIRTGQDYAFWLSILKLGYSVYPINDVLTSYRIVKNSISRNKINKAQRQWQIYRSHENLNLVNSLYCFSFYAYRAVFRK
ncbi:glycosyl transferase family 2 [Vibrio sp. 10N.286.48.B8]|uniref:glycosyltransferase family 2 protein n=1 Tax=Vibrio sp. 10N.286.48.B8 TaxID=2056189 RepID=UPI000D360602|nr:glycosyltransferase family 2 protein [Vibrio sp. 10N.286.48.B8]PTO96264.1 glycosyl transferase family 2 [Vibrio sp. 10N.286.48.B8]